MLPAATRSGIVDAINSFDELYGCTVGYYGGNACSQLASGMIPSINFGRILVILEELDLPGGVMVDVPGLSSPPGQNVSTTPVTIPSTPLFISNNSRVTSEVVGAGLSCGLTIIAGIGVIGGAAAEVPTAGASTIVVVLAWTGFVTSGIQCINGIVRSAEALSNPTTNSLQQWDDNTIYSTAFLIVDALGLASGFAALPATMKNLLAVLQRRGALLSLAQLERMSRAERQVALRAAVQQATRTEEGAAEMATALRNAGLSERQAASVLANGASTARRARTALRAISSVTATRLNAQLLGAISGGLSPLVSASPSRITGSGSGVINSLIVHVLNVQSS